MLLKQSTARNRTFKMISSTDHISLKAGAAPVVNLSKDGGLTFSAAGGVVTEMQNGWYRIALTTTDTNTLGDLSYYITGTGADDTDFADQVVANLLGDTLPVNVLQWNSQTVPATNVTGVPKVDIADWLGTAVTAATAGVPDVNTKNYNNVAAQTDANNLPKVDVEDWKAGVVPATNIAGEPLVDVNHWRGTQPSVLNNSLVQTDVERWLNAVPATPITSGVPLVEWTPSPAELTGTATATGANTITLAAAASTTAHFYNGMIILITSGTGKGQTRIIQEYSTGRVATVSPAWTTVPASNATYIVFPVGMADLETLLCSNSGSGAGVAADLATGVLQVDVVQWSGGFVTFDVGVGLPEVETRNNFDKTGYTLTSAERNSVADALLARSIGTEGYAAKGAVPTLQQALFMLLQGMQERSIASTTLTIKKLDGSTTAMTFTLDSATVPTSLTRAT